MNPRSYWRDLRRGYARSMAKCIGAGIVDYRLNLILAGGCILAAWILLALGGYHSGFAAVRSWGLPFHTPVLEALSKFGETLAAISLIALIARRHPRAVWMGVIASVYATALTHALKGLFEADRPSTVLGNVLVVTGPTLKMHSFPSGHTMTAFLLAACFSVGAPVRTKLFYFALAATVGLSRVWVGAHWPVDVLAGAAIAALSGALAIRTLNFVSWRPGPTPYLLLVLLIGSCAVLELAGAFAYPFAHLPGVAIGTASLCVLARDYAIEPWLRERGNRGRTGAGTAPTASD